MNVTTELKEIWDCPHCGTEMILSHEGPISLYVCPKCGCSTDAEEKHFDADNICPSCFQPMEGNECSHCGYDLGSDFD